MTMRHIITLIALMLATSAYAGKLTCLPKPLGSGTQAVVKSTTKGDFAAWYCPGEEFPNLVVTTKSTASLVATKRAIASVASAPTLTSANAALSAFSGNPYKDPELIAVWKPYAAEILASASK